MATLIRALQAMNRQAEDEHHTTLGETNEDGSVKTRKDSGEKEDAQSIGESNIVKKKGTEKKPTKPPKKRTENHNAEVKVALKQIRALARMEISTGAYEANPNPETAELEPDSEEDMTIEDKRITNKKYFPVNLLVNKDNNRLPISVEGQRLVRVVLRNKQYLNQMRDEGKTRKERKKAGRQPRAAWRRLRTEVSKSLVVGQGEDKIRIAEIMMVDVLGWSGDGGLSDLEDEETSKG